MKKIKIFNSISEFEGFVNRTDIETIQVDIKVVEPSARFPECFASFVYYKEVDATIVNESIINESLLNTKIHHMDLTVRSINRLRDNDIYTLGELIKYSEKQLLEFRGLGNKTMHDIEDTLERYYNGIELKK